MIQIPVFYVEYTRNKTVERREKQNCSTSFVLHKESGYSKNLCKIILLNNY